MRWAQRPGGASARAYRGHRRYRPAVAAQRHRGAAARRVTAPRTIAVLHPGAMGAGMARVLKGAGHRVLCGLEGRSEETRRRAERAGLISISMPQLAAEADIALSVVAPSAAQEVADQLLAAGFRGLLIEANAIRPALCHAIAERVRAAGGQVVDASIMGPPPTQSATQPTRLYLSGPPPCVDIATELFMSTAALHVTKLGAELGKASALKLAQSVVQKASRALALLGHALADRHGLSAQLAAEARRWPHPASDPERFSSVAGRSWRWGDELRDAAQELREAGLPPELATDAAALFDLLAGFEGGQPAVDHIFRALTDGSAEP
ncbi:NAD(P)-dependent oxidoreductase [Microbispora triticiradicis]|uniref:NAD(P)-dependent oxidoreductase n=1 Tax=Microbispora triticiradicis TaxID=2200763 RepID=A0ABX9LNI4_9ACTN|nr:NAD(P)-binding domain-containing protein [Microbispora triticiradicis]RGA05561.1 NAD(P)-dependent oxidoreductase [Microbispora triticiradicis]